MSIPLKQSTAFTWKAGPFIDDTDGKSAKTALTIAQADIRISKNGGDYAKTHNSAGATHDEYGEYDIPLDTTDTGTLGKLKVKIHVSGALPVWQDFVILPANVYDSIFGDSLFSSMRSGTAQAGANGSITLDSSANATDDYYKNALIVIISGTGANQCRTISSYTGSSKVANITPNWVTNPSTDSIFAILPMGAIAGATAPTAGEVADAVWDEALSGHVTAGTSGKKLTDQANPDNATIAGAVWDYLLTAITTTGSIGKLIKDYLDAAISSRLATTGYTAPPTAAAIRGEIDSNSTQLAAIVADTNELQAELADGGRTDLLIDGIKAKTDMQPVVWYSP